MGAPSWTASSPGVPWKSFLPFVKEEDIIHQPVHIFEDMGTKEDGLARIFQLADQIDDFFPAHGVKAAHRFIKNQQFRIIDEGDGKVGPLLHAFGISAQGTASDFPEIQQGQQFLGTLLQ